jgi:hypothetical protein
MLQNGDLVPQKQNLSLFPQRGTPRQPQPRRKPHDK